MKKFLVFIFAITMVVAFTATAMAADWNFYGSSRMTTVYYDKSKEVAGTDFDDADMTWLAQTNSRFGAKVKASDAVSGQFEFQMGQAAGLRLMYGTYNFGSGSLMVGQNYTPVDQIISTSIGDLAYHITGTAPVPDGEGDSLAIGSFYESRKPQVALQFGGLKLAFIQPATVTQGVYTDIDTTLPKIEVSYTLKTDAFSVTPYGGYNTVDMSDPANDSSVTVDSYVIGAAGKFNFGPMYVNANLFWAQNAKDYGRLTTGLYNSATLNGSDTNDAETYGGQVILGFKMSDMFTFEGGYSYDHNEVDITGGGTGENSPSHWYVQSTITLAPGVYIIPEVGMYDFGDNDNGTVSINQGDCIYYGAEWKINF